MRNTYRALAAAAVLGLAVGCGPDDRATTQDPAVQPGMEGTAPGTAPGTYPGTAPGTYPGTAPGTQPGMMPGDTLLVDTLPQTGAPGAPGTTGGR
jgi:hypothetical protein